MTVSPGRQPARRSTTGRTRSSTCREGAAHRSRETHRAPSGQLEVVATRRAGGARGRKARAGERRAATRSIPTGRCSSAPGRDPEAFGEFYDRHWAPVAALAPRPHPVGPHGVELAAETFAQALASVHRYDPARGIGRVVALRDRRAPVPPLPAGGARSTVATGSRLWIATPVVTDDDVERIVELADARALVAAARRCPRPAHRRRPRRGRAAGRATTCPTRRWPPASAARSSAPACASSAGSASSPSRWWRRERAAPSRRCVGALRRGPRSRAAAPPAGRAAGRVRRRRSRPARGHRRRAAGARARCRRWPTCASRCATGGSWSRLVDLEHRPDHIEGVLRGLGLDASVPSGAGRALAGRAASWAPSTPSGSRPALAPRRRRAHHVRRVLRARSGGPGTLTLRVGPAGQRPASPTPCSPTRSPPASRSPAGHLLGRPAADVAPVLADVAARGARGRPARRGSGLAEALAEPARPRGHRGRRPTPSPSTASSCGSAPPVAPPPATTTSPECPAMTTAVARPGVPRPPRHARTRHALAHACEAAGWSPDRGAHAPRGRGGRPARHRTATGGSTCSSSTPRRRPATWPCEAFTAGRAAGRRRRERAAHAAPRPSSLARAGLRRRAPDRASRRPSGCPRSPRGSTASCSSCCGAATNAAISRTLSPVDVVDQARHRRAARACSTRPTARRSSPPRCGSGIRPGRGAPDTLHGAGMLSR